MKPTLLIAAALLLAIAAGAETLEEKALHVSLAAPEGFVRSGDLPDENELIGKPKALYQSPDNAKDGAALLVHHVTLPDGTTYKAFRNSLPGQVSKSLTGVYRLFRQSDVEIGGFSGFMLDFTCPGNGQRPEPDGKVPHHLRWYLFQDGDRNVVGLLYGANDAAWKDLNAKYAASVKTLKRLD